MEKIFLISVTIKLTKAKNAAELKEIWNRIDLSENINEKEKILTEILQKDTLWYLLEPLSKLLYDLATPSRSFIKNLESVFGKTGQDLVNKPILKALANIGLNKFEEASKIRKMILEQISNRELIIQSGFILGGMIKNMEHLLDELITNKIRNETDVSILLSYYKAIFYLCEDKGVINKKYRKLILLLKKLDIKEINLELIRFSLHNYKKNKKLLFQVMSDIISKKDPQYSKMLFFNLHIYLKDPHIRKKKFLKLIEKSKHALDSDLINDIAYSFNFYPKNVREIIRFYIYCINKFDYLKINMFEYTIQEIAKTNPKIIKVFLKRMHKIEKRKTLIVAKSIFKVFVEADIEHSLSITSSTKSKHKNNVNFKLNFYNIIIKECHNEIKYLHIAQNVAKILKDKYSNIPYTEIFSDDIFALSSTSNTEKYNTIVREISSFIETLLERRKEFNFKKILQILPKYPKLKKYGDKIIEECKRDKKYSPLLLLLDCDFLDKAITMQKKDKNQLSEIEKYEIQNAFWAEAILKKLEKSIPVYENVHNDKYITGELKEKKILNSLKNKESFWDFFSELIIMSRIGECNITKKDIIIGDSDIDLQVDLFNKNILFEITNPKIDDKLLFSNRAEFLKNKAFSTLDKKYAQIMKTGAYHDPNFIDLLFYVIIDTSSSVIDKTNLMNALFGSIGVDLYFDKSNNQLVYITESRLSDSLSDKNVKTEIISGVIYFKREVEIDENNNSYVTLEGDVLNNPKGRNVFSEQEIEKIKELLFKN